MKRISSLVVALLLVCSLAPFARAGCNPACAGFVAAGSDK